MRIVIDIQGMQTGSRFRGIGRYTLSLVRAIIINHSEHEIILALNGLYVDTILDIKNIFSDILPKENIRVWSAVGPVAENEKNNDWRRKTSEKIREDFLLQCKADFILITSLFEGYGEDFIGSIGEFNHSTPTAVILYDLIPLINKDIYLADPKVLAWYMKKTEYCEKAELLLAISESSKNEGVKYLDVNKKNIINISTASEDKFRELSLSTREISILRSKFELSKEYLMYSSATDDRKNHLRLIQAYSQLNLSIRAEHQLVFVGGLPEEHKQKFINHAQKCGLRQDELIITNRVSDEEMIQLYNLCKAFIFPSWHEGFGLPVLEAMQCGKAVIASNKSSIPEIVGREDALFDPYDVNDMKISIEKVLTNDTYRKDLEEYSRKRCQMFTWESSAQKAISAIEDYYKKHVTKNKDNNYHANFEDLLMSIAKQEDYCNDVDLIRTASAIDENQLDKQLFIDISELIQTDSKTGIQRVTRSILYGLLNLKLDGWRVEAVYTRPEDDSYYYANVFTQDFLNLPKKKVIDTSLMYSSGDIFLGLDLLHPIIIKSKELYYQSLREHGVKTYFVIYDILPILFPQHSNIGVSEGHREWLDIVTQSNGVICISKSVTNEVKNWIKENNINTLNTFSLDWWHLGADIHNSVPSSGLEKDSLMILNKLRDTTSFLSVGTIEPRKSHNQTLSAFEVLWSRGVNVNFVIVGKKGWLADELVEKIQKHGELGKHLFWLNGISDEYLKKVYEASSCLIAASEGEGFGLPLIEAAQFKMPIIARDIPVFREVAGEFAYYFENDNSSDKLAKDIQKWLKLFESDTHPKSDDMPWLTWEESTENLVHCLTKEIHA